MKRVLFLSRWLPHPPNNGSKLRIYNLLCGKRQHYEISLVTFLEEKERDFDISHLRQLCSDVDTVHWKNYQPSSRRALAGLFNQKPRYLVNASSAEIVQKIEHKVATGNICVVIASQIDMAVYRNHFGDIPALFEEVELASIYDNYSRARSLGRRSRFFFAWISHRRYLADLLNYYDACTVVSNQEMKLLKSAAPGCDSVELIPNCVDLGSYEHVHVKNEQYRMIFTGSLSYRVNYESMVWFVSDIFPLIQKEIPDASLIITGDHADLPFPKLANVNLTGFLDDIRPLVAGSCVSLAPIREGGGTRLKISEAMALRTPVVATSKGAEGLDVQHMVQLLIADTAEDFALDIIELIRDPILRTRLSNNAYQLVRERYNWTEEIPRFLALIEHISQKH